MPGVKTTAMTLRVTPKFKELVDLAAKREQRSRTNLIEKLVIEHCRAVGLTTFALDEVATPMKSPNGELEGA
jgi:uncharacterized protein (DUF1778 family)